MESYLKNIGNNTILKNSYLLANSYNIEEFSPEDIKEITGGVVAIIAGTGSGKSVLLKDLLSHTHTNYKKIHLMSRTAKLQKFFDFVPRSMISDDYDEKKLEEIWNSQLKLNEEGRPLEPILVILDDIIASNSYKKSKMLEECSISARHLNITVILLSQNFTSIKPIIRNNIRIAICFQMQSAKERAKFSEQFLGADSARAGDILLRKITDVPYQCLIVQVYKNGKTISEKVKKYIANPDVKIVIKDPEEDRIIKETLLLRPHKPKVITRTKLVNKWGI